MLWEIEIRPLGRDAERERVCDEFDLLTHSRRGAELVRSTARGYLIESDIERDEMATVMLRLLVDPLVESGRIEPLDALATILTSRNAMYTVLPKPGVMDPVAESVIQAFRDHHFHIDAVRSFRRYFGPAEVADDDKEMLCRKILANDAIELIHQGSLQGLKISVGDAYTFNPIKVAIRQLDNAALEKLSKDGQLALTLPEMQTIQAYFVKLDRDPFDIELETIAQTWSEHCSHKTLKGAIEYTESIDGKSTQKHFKNLLKETIFGATQTIRQRLGSDDWCVSVFADNAGVIKFNDEFHACFKVETHNHPSAIEPYGGANTGIGGVIRDPMGTGLGAKPVANTDVFCFAPPNYPADKLPPGVLHPRRIMKGVVTGVKDYGNRMGIPTINGAILFDERYLGNPLVYCGTVGILPVDCVEKAAKPGDYIVAVGGRTGRDGIHGATFSSLELTEQSEKLSGGAVQIGNAITEKKVLDVILQARDRKLYHAITDCGAGGFSSAVGEMGADLGASVQLENAPLKYNGLSYTEIWISESQERMVLAVDPANWDELNQLCESEGVEAAILGTFEATGKLKLFYQQNQVGEMDMHFLHEGMPKTVRKATWSNDKPTEFLPEATPHANITTKDRIHEILKAILSEYSIASKEWVIRQYDHEVQGGSVIKPLVGVHEDGPGNASVIMPVLGVSKGLAVGCGLNQRYGDIDPYWMAAAAIDEALRNVVSVGADPSRTAILDNFCWGNVHDAEILGSLVRTAVACRDAALAYGTPFISGKDSLNNTYVTGGKKLSIPGTLLISAIGLVPEVTECVTMDLKEPNNLVILIGNTSDELGGSYHHLVTRNSGGNVPKVDFELAPKILLQLHHAIRKGYIRACHDLSEGGLIVALSEMAFAGGFGVDVTNLNLPGADGLSDEVKLFSESQTRFLVEVRLEDIEDFEDLFDGLPLISLGTVQREPRIRVAGADKEWILWARSGELKEAWQKPLRW
jgi:phosphoribosylformylglycinamidine synthase subunit PurSL